MKIAVAREGARFLERDLDLQWPRGGGERNVAIVPDDRNDWSPTLRAAFDRGDVVDLATAEPDVPSKTSLGQYSKAQLVVIAVERGVDPVGTKAELVARIEADAGYGGNTDPVRAELEAVAVELEISPTGTNEELLEAIYTADPSRRPAPTAEA